MVSCETELKNQVSRHSMIRLESVQCLRDYQSIVEAITAVACNREKGLIELCIAPSRSDGYGISGK